MQKTRSCLLSFFLIVAASQPLPADLIISPSGGQTIFSSMLNSLSVGNYLDDVVEQRSLGLSNFQLFGQSVSQMWITDNGQMNSSGQPFFFPHRLSSVNTNMIAPLWDDGLLFKLPDGYAPNNRIVEHVLADTWYSITWENVRLHLETTAGQSLPNTQRSAQAVLFGQDHVISGFQFLRNDIAFSYRSHDGGLTNNFVDPVREAALPQGSQLNAAVGLAGPGGRSVSMWGGGPNGIFSAHHASTHLPTSDRRFILFREQRDNAGQFSQYVVSIERLGAVPEPQAGLLCVVAGIIAAWSRRRKVVDIYS